MDLQRLGNEATKPLASEVFAGDNCPFSMLVARGRVVTLLVPVATPRAFSDLLSTTGSSSASRVLSS